MPTSEKILLNALRGKNDTGRLPVWLMRQAGRYHPHYQELKKRYSFRDLCLRPELACETTLGPVEDYNLDAAIIFSDILYVLESLGARVEYPESGPKIAFKILSLDEVSRLHRPEPTYFQFQREACHLTREALPKDVTLIGFAGSPWTLFVFLTEATYKGELSRARALYQNGTFDRVAPFLEEAIFWSLLAQWQGGAEVLQIFDTAAMALTPQEYAGSAAQSHERLLERVNGFCQDLIFFSRGTSARYYALNRFRARCLSVDWDWKLGDAFEFVGPDRSVQGNFPAQDLFLDPRELERRVIEHYTPFAQSPRLIANLGHGVLPGTPPENVRLFVETIRSLKAKSSGKMR